MIKKIVKGNAVFEVNKKPRGEGAEHFSEEGIVQSIFETGEKFKVVFEKETVLQIITPEYVLYFPPEEVEEGRPHFA